MVVHALMSCKCPTWAWNTQYGWTFPRARVATHQTALDFTWRTLHSRVTDICFGDVTARRSHQWSIVSPTPIFSCAAVPEHGNVRAETQKCATAHIKRVVLATNVCNHLNDKGKSTNISRKSWSYGHKLSESKLQEEESVHTIVPCARRTMRSRPESKTTFQACAWTNTIHSKKTASIEARPKRELYTATETSDSWFWTKLKIGQDIEKCGKLFIHQWFGLINRTWNLSSTECLPFP